MFNDDVECFNIVQSFGICLATFFVFVAYLARSREVVELAALVARVGSSRGRIWPTVACSNRDPLEVQLQRVALVVVRSD